MPRSFIVAGGWFAAAMLAATPLAAQKPVVKDRSLHDGAVTQPPGGWIDYCGRNAGDPACRPAPAIDVRGGDAAALDDAGWARVEHVHAELEKIRQVDEKGPVDRWTVAQSSGDCEDIALAGRQKLLAAGFPRRAIRLATATTEEGERHVVVTLDAVRDGKRDTWVLDNRFDEIKRWDELEASGYRFQARQAPSGPFWVSLRTAKGSPLS